MDEHTDAVKQNRQNPPVRLCTLERLEGFEEQV